MKGEPSQIVALLLSGLLIPGLSQQKGKRKFISIIKARLISLFSSRPLLYRTDGMDDIISSLTNSDIESITSNESSSLRNIPKHSFDATFREPRLVTIHQGFECISFNMGNAMKQASMKERVREATIHSINALEEINKWEPTISLKDLSQQEEIIETLKESLKCYKQR